VAEQREEVLLLLGIQIPAASVLNLLRIFWKILFGCTPTPWFSFLLPLALYYKS